MTEGQAIDFTLSNKKVKHLTGIINVANNIDKELVNQPKGTFEGFFSNFHMIEYVCSSQMDSCWTRWNYRA